MYAKDLCLVLEPPALAIPCTCEGSKLGVLLINPVPVGSVCVCRLCSRDQPSACARELGRGRRLKDSLSGLPAGFQPHSTPCIGISHSTPEVHQKPPSRGRIHLIVKVRQLQTNSNSSTPKQLRIMPNAIPKMSLSRVLMFLFQWGLACPLITCPTWDKL